MYPSPSLEPTMRQSRPPVRFSQEEFVAKAQKTELCPSEGQSTKNSGIVRLPEMGVHQSRIPKAGFGLFFREEVRKGQILTVYRRKIISEKKAKELKKKVAPFYFIHHLHLFCADSLLEGQSPHSRKSFKMLLPGLRANSYARL